MNIIEKVGSDFQKALKEKDEIKLSTLRLLKAAITKKEKENGKTPTDDEVIKIIAKEISSRKEAAEIYKGAGKTEMAEKENQEAEILKVYMPEEISDDQLNALIDKAIVEVGAAGMQDMGKVMGRVMPQTAGRADGSKVSGIVRNKLSAKN